MDKIKRYKKIARQVVTEAGKLGERPDDPIQTQFIMDDENGHYLLYFSGWRGERRTYGCFLHLDIFPDGKVWLQYDGTDLRIAQELVDKGIPKSDIVLGFQAPVRRPDTGYAVA